MKKKKWGLALIGILVLCVLAGVGIFIGMHTKEVKLEQQMVEKLSLGNQYLNELDYEHAIMEYEAIIKIEPKNEEAILGLADVYVRTEEYEKALEVVESGYKNVGSERINEQMDLISKKIATVSLSLDESEESEESEESGEAKIEDGIQEYAEDFIIQWEDKAMESCIRQALGKETGEITVSDVKDIEALYINKDSCSIGTYREDGRYAAEEQRILFNNENASNGTIISLEDLKFFKSLVLLSLNDNHVSDLNGITGLTNLKQLYLFGNNIEDISVLSKLINLKKIGLGKNNISDLSALSNLTKVTELFLYENKISDISSLKMLINLETLVLMYNNVSDVSVVANLTKLTYLDLADNNISDISSLEGLTNLNILLLQNNNITDFSPIENLDIESLMTEYDVSE